MPSLSKHIATDRTKMLLIGDPGAGKTGALASLASDGYNLRIIDMDDGLDVLRNLLAEPNSPYAKDAINRVHYVTITDPWIQKGNLVLPKSTTAWNRLLTTLTNWKTSTEELGPVTNWGPKDILVIDSLTLACQAAFIFVCNMKGKIADRPTYTEWYDAQNLIERLMQMLYSDEIKCNVIVTSHISFITDQADDKAVHGYPMSLGKALSPKLGRYFNHLLMIKTLGGKQMIFTKSRENVELKNTNPLKVKPAYNLATGLAEYFRDVRGKAKGEASGDKATSGE